MSTATPQRIRQITRDNVVVRATDPAVRSLHPRARPVDTVDPFETFYDDPADAQAILDERFALLKVKARHAAVEIDDDIDVGGSLSISPTLPSLIARDDVAGINFTGRLRGSAINGATDRMAVEIYG
ncbi:MAG TPA: hypothetical protein DDZ68_12825 [Parvularcula sp.]|nr:hypothetical protein [Parvularcula sp.]